MSTKSKEGVKAAADWLYDNIPSLSIQSAAAKQGSSETGTDKARKHDVVDNV